MTEKISKAQQRRDAKLQRQISAADDERISPVAEQDPPGTVHCLACGCKTVRPAPPVCGH